MKMVSCQSRVSPYNRLQGETPPERGTFFELEVYKRVGNSPIEIYNRVGELNKWYLSFNNGYHLFWQCLMFSCSIVY